MTKKEALERLCYVSDHISECVDTQKKAGKKIVGVLPVYAPVELVHAAGLFPVGCWGGEVTLMHAQRFLPPFGCSIMQSVIEMAARGDYKNLDAFLISTPCDTLRCNGQNLKSAAPEIKALYCIAPTNSKSEAGVTYYKKELRRLCSKLEELGGSALSNKAINESIALYNENRLVLQEFSDLTGKYPGAVSAVERHAVLRSRLYMDIQEHTEIVKVINEEIRKHGAQEVDTDKKKLFLAGITAEPGWFLEILDDLGYAVVGDELAQEWRQIATLVPPGLDPLERIARQHQNRSACSLILDGTKSRSHFIAERAKGLRADGVLYCQMKFCDPEEQDFPSVRNAVTAAGIPILNIEIDQNTRAEEQCLTRLQTFLDILR